jgi:hypothetical protein
VAEEKRGGSCELEFEVPSFSNQIKAEAMVRFAVDELKTGVFVDAPGGIEMALRPERDFLVAGFAREANAFVHQAAADAEAARAGLDVKEAELDLDFFTRKTEPAISPSRSAIQQRSRCGSKFWMNSPTIRAASASNCARDGAHWRRPD